MRQQPVAEKVHERINEFRTQHGRAPLKWNTVIAERTQAHSEKMATERNLRHSANPPCNENILRSATYGWGFFVRFLSIPLTNDMIASQAVNSWTQSPGHRANVLSSSFETGVGVGINIMGGVYMTQWFCKGEPSYG